MHATGCTNRIGQIACASWERLYYGTIVHAWNWETVQKRDRGEELSACISVAFSNNETSKSRKRKRKRKRKKEKKKKNSHLEAHLMALDQRPRKPLLSANLANQPASPSVSPQIIHRLRTRLAAMIRPFQIPPVASPDHRFYTAQRGTMQVVQSPAQSAGDNNRCSTSVE